jgi:hypothetical protein
VHHLRTYHRNSWELRSDEAWPSETQAVPRVPSLACINIGDGVSEQQPVVLDVKALDTPLLTSTVEFLASAVELIFAEQDALGQQGAEECACVKVAAHVRIVNEARKLLVQLAELPKVEARRGAPCARRNGQKRSNIRAC